MVDNRTRYRRQSAPSASAGFGWMVLASLAVHAATGGLLAGVVRVPRSSAPTPYRVELVSHPVARPQAGLPQGAESIAPAARPAAEPQTPGAAKATAKNSKAAPVALKGSGKAVPVPEDSGDYAETLGAIEKLKEKKQYERDTQALKARLVQMFAEEEERKAAPAPLGTQDGRGDQAGGQYAPWIKAQVKAYWTLPPALVTRLDLEAEVEIEFNAQGARTRYHFLESSRDARFDDSIRRALVQLEQLPTPPGDALRVTITFNLKDLLER